MKNFFSNPVARGAGRVNYRKRILNCGVALLLLGGGLNAQYYVETFGDGVLADVATSGVVTNALPGNAIVGNTAYPGLSQVSVARTDVNGTVIFSNRYLISNANGSVSATAEKIIELPNGQTAVFGHWIPDRGQPATDLFLLMLNTNGTVAFEQNISFSPAPGSIQAVSMCFSPLNGLFLCANYEVNNISSPVVINVTTGGTVNWTRRYTGVPIRAYDMIFGWNELALVGESFPNYPGGTSAGCFFRASLVNGVVIDSLRNYGFEAYADQLLGVTTAIDEGTGNPAYAVCGGTRNPDQRVWAMKINQSGSTVFWSTLLVPFQPAAVALPGYDIISRLNTANMYEYYIVSGFNEPAFNTSSGVVYELIANGMPQFNGEFIYGDIGKEVFAELDKSATGISLFGTTSGSFPPYGVDDLYLVKAYFNGVTACNELFITPPYSEGEKTVVVRPIASPSLAASDVEGGATIFSLEDRVVCFSWEVFTGENGRLHAEENEAETSLVQDNVYPNPINSSDPHVTLALGATAEESQLQVSLWNTLGQRCMEKSISVPAGTTQLPIALDAALAPGVYQLIVTRNGERQQFKLVIE